MIGESAVSFICGGEWLYGIIHRPSQPLRRGVVVVVGGPQYRVGSHRQFLLLARHLAQAGTAVLRFDCRGMGDSGGEERNFERIDEDIRAAVECLVRHVPEIEEIVLWGLCDAASASLFYAPTDRRVSGLILLNPWVRTEQTVARTYLRHYYVERLRDPAFWRKFVRGEFRVGQALRSLAVTALDALRRPAVVATSAIPAEAPLPDRMLAGLQRFRGRVLLVLSGDDITAKEFKDIAASSSAWTRALSEPRVTRFDLAEANHTFSRRDWRERVSRWTADWLRTW